MNIRLLLQTLGGLLIFLGAMLLTPLVVSVWFGDGAILTFLCSSAITLSCGLLLTKYVKSRDEFTLREGFGIVTFGWMAFALFGGLPFLLCGALSNPVDAFFEAMSGFTTTGSTVITDIPAVPESVLFWRAMTQWLGGMGIIVLSLAILPFLGVAGMQLFEAEVPGPTADRLRPRIQDTAKLLWGVYFLITAAEVVFLMFGGLSLYEAVCHAFTTMATGGFSTRNESINGFDSTYVHLVITFFMFLAGVNFSLHFHALRGRVTGYFRSEEFRTYVGLTGTAILIVFLVNVTSGKGEGGVLISLRDSAFTSVSLMTTTGYCTADYELWPVLSQYVLITLMFLGGCAGSTGGGMKIVRVLLLFKHSLLQLSRLVHPRQVKVLKLDQKPVSNEIIQSILGFFALYIGVFLVASLAMSGLGIDLVTSGASVIACLSNIGPALGEVGPTDTFAGIPWLGKLILSACMLLGRLELFTVLVLLFPTYWRK